MAKNVVVIGGGTGVFTVLTGLKKYPYNLKPEHSRPEKPAKNTITKRISKHQPIYYSQSPILRNKERRKKIRRRKQTA